MKIAPILAAGAAVGAAIGLTGVIATVVGVGILAVGAVLVTKALMKSMMPDMSDFSTQGSQGIMVNKTGSSVSLPVVYGETRTGGVRVFTTTEGSIDNGTPEDPDVTPNPYLHLVYAICEGEINACKKIFFDGEEVMNTTATGPNSSWTFVDSKYSGNVDAYFYSGTDTQSANSALNGVASWTGTPAFKGVAYMYFRMTYDADVWKNGLPEITFLIEGKKVPATSNGTTLQYSDNPARCVLDYLSNSRYGKGIAVADIDLPSFQAAETYFTSKGWTTRGNLDTNANMFVNVLDLFANCRSYLAFGNKYRLIPEKAETTISLALTDDNIIGDITYALGDRTTMFNSMKAKIMNASDNYHDDLVIVSDATLKSQDNGIVLEAEVSFPYIKNAAQAQQIITEEINQSRQSHLIELTATIEAVDLQVGDLVTVTNETFGITNKEFRVLMTELLPSSEVTLSLREYDADVYGSSIITDAKGDNNS